MAALRLAGVLKPDKWPHRIDGIRISALPFTAIIYLTMGHRPGYPAGNVSTGFLPRNLDARRRT
jgi:hypothetical protein